MPPAVVIGAGIAAAGAAGLASSVITSNAQKKAAEEQVAAQKQQLQAQQAAAAQEQKALEEATAKKQAAVNNITYPTYLSTPEGLKYKQTLEDRMAGRGLIDVNAQTSPIANQIRAGLKQTNAAIGSAASARGLGRSTVATSQMGEASQAAERDIAERMAQLELARQDQIQQAITGYGALSEQEAASQQNKAKFQQSGEFSVADTMTGAAQEIKTNEFAIADTLAKKGAAEAADKLLQGQILAAGLIGLGSAAQEGAGQYATYQLLEKLLAEKNTRSNNPAMVNTGLTTTSKGIGIGLGG